MIHEMQELHYDGVVLNPADESEIQYHQLNAASLPYHQQDSNRAGSQIYQRDGHVVALRGMERPRFNDRLLHSLLARRGSAYCD